MAKVDDPVVLFDWGEYRAQVRTRATGKQRVTVEIRGDALGIETDERKLAEPLAIAMAEAIKDGIRNKLGFASEATRFFRQRAEKAFAAGEKWARKRYSGGRTGAMRPNVTSPARKGVDSGRLVNTTIANWSPAAQRFHINVAANRLGPDPEIRSKMLMLLAPIIANILKAPSVQDVAVKVKRNLVRLGKNKSAFKQADFFKKGLELANSASGAINAAEDFAEEPKPED